MNAKYIHLFVIILMVGQHVVFGKVYTRCGLTQELVKNGFSRTLVGNCEYNSSKIYLYKSIF